MDGSGEMMRFPSPQQFLVVYSGVLTLAFGVIVLGGFAVHRDRATFDEVSLHRLNIVEPDGTLRMVLSNQDRLPGSYVKGKEYPHPERKAAGALFYNNEGTEAGGLIYGSFLDKEGKPEEANVHLSFDQYMQDQVFTVDAGLERDRKFSLLRIGDVGDYSILDAIQANERIHAMPEGERDAAWAKFAESHPGDHPRVVLGRAEDRSAVLNLKDAEGHDRLTLRVAADGSPAIQLLDAKGRVTREIR